MENDLLQAYERTLPVFSRFSRGIEGLLKSLLAAKGLKHYSVSTRVKSLQSLEQKILVKQKYSSLAEITDIVGIRVITYFEDEVDIVAELIEQEFTVDHENSQDKRELLEIGRSGYRSQHFVVELNQQRVSLTEYADYSGLKVEIQVRSILQHIWAEIEHDLGYKAEFQMPSDLRQRFTDVAALLASADREFIQLRDALADYAGLIQDRILSAPEQVKIEKFTLRNYIDSGRTVATIEAVLFQDSDQGRLKIYDMASIIYMLEAFGITTIRELDQTLLEHKNEVEDHLSRLFSEDSLRHGGTKPAGRGLSIASLALVLFEQLTSQDEKAAFVKRVRELEKEARNTAG